MNTQTVKNGLSVRTKLIGLAVGTALLALLLACAAFVQYDRVSYAEAKRSTLSVLVDSVSQSAFGPTAFQDVDSATVILKVLESEPSAETGAIFGQDGARLAVWSRKASKTTAPATLSALKARDGYVGSHLYVTRSIKNPEQTVGTLHVVFSTSDIQARTRAFIQLAGMVLLVSALVALALAMIAQKVLTRPVRILSDAARRVQEHNDLDVRAERVSGDELGQLTDAFNAMLTMIQARDAELNQHKANLEELVAVRTRDLDQRNQEMRLVLDNVDQGLVIVDRDGKIGPERSAVLKGWFGSPANDMRLGDYIEARAPGFRDVLAMGWGQLIEGALPLELNIAQLPMAVQSREGRHFELSYRAIGARDDYFDKLLVIISDVTTRVEKERGDAEQAQMIAMFEHLNGDRNGFIDFFEETESMLERLSSDAPRDLTLEMRELHTLKGNFGLFGMKLLARLIHQIEDDCLERGAGPTKAQRNQLGQAWSQIADRARTLLGDGAMSMTVGRGDVEDLLRNIRAGKPVEELATMTRRLLLDPVGPKLARIGERARMLAERLGKSEVKIDIEADGVRAPGDIGWLWHVLPHIVSNSIDHGIDMGDQRQAQGKARTATLRLSARERDSHLIIEVSDDGRGINWDALRRKASTLGMPAQTQEDLTRALFADGVSTKDSSTEVSGRGIGLAAVESACKTHGAQIHVSTEPGKGTTFRFTVPTSNHRARPSVPLQRHSIAS